MAKSTIFHETFKNKQLNDQLKWLHEPKEWQVDPESSQLVFKTDVNTDYWQKTHYGFQRDDGHFLYTKTDRNFRLTTKIKATPKTQYDQAGLMIRYSENYWIKASLEYIKGSPSKLGAVVTNHGQSDWSTQEVDIDVDAIELYYRISKIGKDCFVDFSWDGESWSQIRIAHLATPEDEPVLAGIYGCSPQGKDQEVRVDFLKIEELGDNSNEAYL